MALSVDVLEDMIAEINSEEDEKPVKGTCNEVHGNEMRMI